MYDNTDKYMVCAFVGLALIIILVSCNVTVVIN